MTASADTEARPTRRNPYRGPREFGRGDYLPNRQPEARRLSDRVVAERVVLLYSPSGAGKTSLIEAAVIHQLMNEGFWPTPRLRVNEPFRGDRVRNRYIHSLVTYLLASSTGSEPPEDMTLSEAVGQWRAHEQPKDTNTVLIIDQLEEILTLDPTDWDTKDTFFRELGMLLQAEPVWALLSIREEYLGGLDRYLRFVPGLLRSPFRLGFLSWDDAKLAMQVPAQQQGVEFKTKAANALVDRLAAVYMKQPGESPIVAKAPYVEPIQLQIVCRLLWRNIHRKRGNDFLTIDISDIDNAYIDRSLTLYFDQTVADVARVTNTSERNIRDWFESNLITKQHSRSQTRTPPQSTNPQAVLSLLEEAYLLLRYARWGSIWHELVHDRFIEPVLVSNATWRRSNLAPWQIMADEWNASGRNPALLLPAAELPKASPRSDITDGDRDFLEASAELGRHTGILARMRGVTGFLAIIAIIEAIVIAVLLIGLMAR